MGYFSSKHRLQRLESNMKHKGSVSRYEINQAFDVIFKNMTSSRRVDCAVLLGSFLSESYKIDGISTNLSVKSKYNRMVVSASNNNSRKLKECLEKADKSTAEKERFCRKTRLPKKLKNFCWASVLMGEAMWKGFCYARWAD